MEYPRMTLELTVDGRNITLVPPFFISGSTDALMSLARQLSRAKEPGGWMGMSICGDADQMKKAADDAALANDERILQMAEAIKAKRAAPAGFV